MSVNMFFLQKCFFYKKHMNETIDAKLMKV